MQALKLTIFVYWQEYQIGNNTKIISMVHI